MSSHSQTKQPNNLNKTAKRESFFIKPIPLYVFILVFIPLSAITLHFYNPLKATNNQTKEVAQGNIPYNACATVTREKDSSLIAPLLFVDIHDDQLLIPAKTKIINYIEQKKREGIITTASVYLNDLNNSSQMQINPDELYDPASIMKVSLMISYLKKSESDPSLLSKRYLFKEPANKKFVANIKDKTLELGKSYTVEELLNYMIAYSDNEAFLLLANNMDRFSFNLLNEEFEIPKLTGNLNEPSKRPNFVANVNSVSRFFRVLYNASYLNRKKSEYALRLLCKCNYKDGIVKGVDPSVKVAHKFGERMENGVAELHEFGIVYLKNRPYLLGVMTKGTNLSQLPEIVSSISKIAYDELKTK